MEDEIGKVLSNSSTHVTTVEAIEDYDSEDLEDGEVVPTIELSEHAEICDLESQANTEKIYDDEISQCEEDAPVAVPLGSLLSTGGMANEFNSSRQGFFRQRPEFISVGLIKPKKRTDLGLTLSELVDGGTGLCVTGIKKDGLLFTSGANIELGDRVVSLNNQSCDEMDHKRAAKLLRGAPGPVSIVVQNIGGNPQMVECMITKSSPDQRTGIGFSSNESNESPARVNISSIFVDGLFADSLLSEG